MDARNRLILVVCILPLGCVHHYHYQNEVRHAEFQMAFSNFISGRHAYVQLVNGRDFTGQNLYLEQDSLHWNYPVTELPGSSPIHDISFVTVNISTRGAIEGLVLGIAVGGTGGYITGYLRGDDPPGQFIRIPAEFKAMVTAVNFGTLGALLGVSVGALKGSELTFWFNEVATSANEEIIKEMD